MASLLVVNGPNLNTLGTRQPEIYGAATLADIEASCRAEAAKFDCDLSFMQSNDEGALVDAIQSARGRHEGLILNAAAYTHSSIAIRDAVLVSELPMVEVHLSNTYKREAFRHQSYLSDIAIGVIMGFGATSYTLAVRAMAEHLAP
ncbi:MAG: type II 3-dehydroquinate dehydratase [Pseudomonadota bacterium]